MKPRQSQDCKVYSTLTAAKLKTRPVSSSTRFKPLRVRGGERPESMSRVHLSDGLVANVGVQKRSKRSPGPQHPSGNAHPKALNSTSRSSRPRNMHGCKTFTGRSFKTAQPCIRLSCLVPFLSGSFSTLLWIWSPDWRIFGSGLLIATQLPLLPVELGQIFEF